jgi:hypothetical protein
LKIFSTTVHVRIEFVAASKGCAPEGVGRAPP